MKHTDPLENQALQKMLAPILKLKQINQSRQGSGTYITKHQIPDPKKLETIKYVGQGERVQTELGDEEQEHENGGSEGNNATGKCTAVEILVDLRVSIQVPKLVDYAVHGLPPKTD